VSELKLGDMAVVIHKEGFEYDKGCGPGTLGVVETQCFCFMAHFHADEGPVVKFTTAAQQTYCIQVRLLRRIDPPGDERGNWDNCVWQPNKEKVSCV